MQRSNLFMKVVSAVVLLALLCYMGVYVYNSAANPFKTALTVNYTVTNGYDMEGMLVRGETVLPPGGAMLETVPEEGEKVSSGGLIAVEYSSDEVLAAAYEMKTLEAQIEQMETVLKFGETGTELLAIDTMAGDLALKLSRMLSSGDLSDIPQLSAEFRTLTYYSDNGSLEESETRLAELKNRLYTLKKQSDSGVRYVYAPESGLFSAAVDGFECLTPATLSDLTAEQLEYYMGLETGPGESGLGKIVSGVKWYLAALVPTQDAKLLRVGGDVSIKLDKYCAEELPMIVTRIAGEKDGKTMVVFCCSRAMSGTVSTRKITGKIVSSTVSGIRVPKEAVKLDSEGLTCVYSLTGAQAELKHISILEEVGDYYIVQNDTANTSALRAGDEVIVSAKDLYDGKVVK